MLLGNASLMAILWAGPESERPKWAGPEPERLEWAGPESERPESAGLSLQYLYLLLAKVALNCFLMAFARCGLARSFMGLSFLALCLADFLLAATLGTAALLGGDHGDTLLVAFLLTHASYVYAFLPLPTLALGALDLASTVRKESARRGAMGGRAVAVLSLWAAAGFYSAWRTDPSVLEVVLRTRPAGLVQVCEVQVSRQVTLFCLPLLVGVVVTLLLHLPDVPRWVAHINRQTARMEWMDDSESRDLPVSCVDAQYPSLRDCQRHPPLYLSCVLLWAVHWCPYLLVHLSSEMLELAVPSYASVNTLWLSCANSLLVGIIYWRHGGHQDGHQHLDFITQHLDAICDWKIAGYLSYHSNHDPPPHKLPLELQTPSDRKLKPLLLL